MSPKELLYIEDALGHEQFLKTQCQDTANNLQDGELKNYVSQLVICLLYTSISYNEQYCIA